MYGCMDYICLYMCIAIARIFIFCAMIWKLRLLILIFSLVVAKPADMLLGVCEGIPRDEQKADGPP